MHKPHKWSYSAHSSFDKCPLQYQQTRLLRNFKVDSPQIREGNRVHKLFEDRVGLNQPLPPEWAHYEPMIANILTLPGVASAELKLKLDDNAAPLPDDGSWEYWVIGIIDLLILNEGDGTAFVIDWKTGKSAYADTQQLKLMALLIFAHFPSIHTVKGMLLFVKDSKPVPAEFTRDKILEYWEQFMPGYLRMVAARDSGVYNAKPSGLCSVCPVTTCDHHRG
jgi:hypothetical protein